MAAGFFSFLNQLILLLLYAIFMDSTVPEGVFLLSLFFASEEFISSVPTRNAHKLSVSVVLRIRAE